MTNVEAFRNASSWMASFEEARIKRGLEAGGGSIVWSWHLSCAAWWWETCLQLGGRRSQLPELPLNLGTVHSDVDSVRLGSGKIILEEFFSFSFESSEWASLLFTTKQTAGRFSQGPTSWAGWTQKAVAKSPPLSVLFVRKYHSRNAQTMASWRTV